MKTETTKSTTNIIRLVLKAVGLAMGVAVVVLGTLGALDPQSAITLLAIGLTALGLDALQDA